MNDQRQKDEQQDMEHNRQQQSEQHKMAENPNPRANENVPDSQFKKETDENSDLTGSEITDGEDG